MRSQHQACVLLLFWIICSSSVAQDTYYQYTGYKACNELSFPGLEIGLAAPEGTPIVDDTPLMVYMRGSTTLSLQLEIREDDGLLGSAVVYSAGPIAEPTDSSDHFYRFWVPVGESGGVEVFARVFEPVTGRECDSWILSLTQGSLESTAVQAFGPAEVDEGSSAQYRATIYFNDGVTRLRDVNPSRPQKEGTRPSDTDSINRKVAWNTFLGNSSVSSTGVYSAPQVSSDTTDQIDTEFWFNSQVVFGFDPINIRNLPDPVPGTPGSISYPSSSSTGSFTVSWSSVSGATSYELARSSNGGSTWSTIFSGNATSRGQDLGDGSYRYRARACNSSGCSSWRTGTFDIIVNTPDPVPGTPGSISYPSSSSTGSFTVSWSSVSGATSYELSRSSNGGSTWSTIFSGNATSRSQNLGDGSYRYRARACNSSGCSSWRTGTFDITVNIVDPVPTAPASISYPSSNSTGSFTVSWSSVSGATSYELARSSNEGSTWSTIFSGNATSRSQNLGDGSYRYRARACNSSGCSNWRTGTFDILVDTSGGAGSLLIFEVDPDTPDFIELYNPSQSPVNLDNWVIESGNDSNVTRVVLPPFLLQPGHFVTVNETSGLNTHDQIFLGQNIYLINSGGWVSLLNSSGVTGADFLRYGVSSIAPPAGTNWSGPNAPSPPGGETVGRVGLIDSDLESDWCIGLPTMSADNSPCKYDGTCSMDYFDGGLISSSMQSSACRWVDIGSGSQATIGSSGSLTAEAGETIVLRPGLTVEVGGTLEVRTCAHDLCSEGSALEAECHSCVTDICSVDPYCCDAGWDGLCVEQVGSGCGKQCP